MIAKHALGADFRGLLIYLLREGMEGREHEANLLGGNMSGRNAGELAHEFGMFRRLNMQVRYPVFHASLRLPSDERLTNTQWQRAAAEYLTGMGYTDTAYIVVKHPENHIHIAAGRVRFDGSSIPTWRDRWRSLRVLEAIEAHFGLAHPPRPTPETRRRSTHPQLNRDHAAERRAPSPMEILAQRLQRAVVYSGIEGARVVDGPPEGEGIPPSLIRDARIALARLQRWNGHLAEETVLGLAALRLGRAHPEVAAPTITAALEAADPAALSRVPGGRAALTTQMEGARAAHLPDSAGAPAEEREYWTR